MPTSWFCQRCHYQSFTHQPLPVSWYQYSLFHPITHTTTINIKSLFISATYSKIIQIAVHIWKSFKTFQKRHKNLLNDWFPTQTPLWQVLLKTFTIWGQNFKKCRYGVHPPDPLLAHSAKLQDQQSWPVTVLQPSLASLKGHLIAGTPEQHPRSLPSVA